MNQIAAVQPTKQMNQLERMAMRLNIQQEELENVIFNTVMPSGGRNVSHAQVVSFLAIANEYGLNPMAREVYAFPAKGGGIQTIVGIDGWLTIINNNPNFDGFDIEFSETKIEIGGKQVPEWCKVIVYRKDRTRPVTAIEYMEECHRNTDPWKQKPRRMLQHKATIQAARYAFGMSGIMDEDEAERYQEAGLIKDVTPAKPQQPKRQGNGLERLMAKRQAAQAQPEPQRWPADGSAEEQAMLAAGEKPSNQERRKEPEPVTQPAGVETHAIEENHDPVTAADLYCNLMEGAQDLQHLDEIYKEGYNRLNQIGNYWKSHNDMEQAQTCAMLKNNINAAYYDQKAKLAQEVGA